MSTQFTKQGSNTLNKTNFPQQYNNEIGRVLLCNPDGTIYYETYDITSNTSKIGELNILSYPQAIPLNPSDKFYPLVGELVKITKGPSPKSVTSNSQIINYYEVINLWNNTNNNAQFDEQEIPFKQKEVPQIYSFPGDKIINSRYGSNIRLSATNTDENNFWKDGKDGDQIIIISNTSGSLENIEEDNLLILSSNQKIPLKTYTSNSNKITKTILPKNSSLKSQFLNAERIVLNSFKDDILLYSNNNTEIYSAKNISLNTERILLDASKICLGQNKDQEPTDLS